MSRTYFYKRDDLRGLIHVSLLCLPTECDYKVQRVDTTNVMTWEVSCLCCVFQVSVSTTV
jgi:hypothetical protein